MSDFDELLNGVHSPTVTDIAVLVREVRVRIGVLSKPVTIRIYYNDRDPQPFTHEISAFMRTGGASGMNSEAGGCATENQALRHAVRLLTQDYEDAVRRGEMPDDQWLIEPSSAATRRG